MDFSRQVNYQSDFDVLLHIVDVNNAPVGFPDFDFILTFTTNGGNKVQAGQQDGVKRGVVEENGDLKIAFDNHKLLPGVLNLEVRTNIEDATYPDGKKLTVFTVPTNITLVSGASEVSTGMKIDVKLPFAYQKESSSSSSTSSEEPAPSTSSGE